MVSTIHDLEQEVLAEMSMVDIVYTLLKNGAKEPRSFHDLLNEAAELKNLSEEMKLEVMARLYTDINIDGRFKCVGNNCWGLRSWYAVEQAEEIVITDLKKRPKKKRLVDPDFEDYDEDELLELDDEDDELDVYDELLDDEEDEDEEEEEDYEDLEDLEDLEDIDELDDPDFEADELEQEPDEEDDLEEERD